MPAVIDHAAPARLITTPPHEAKQISTRLRYDPVDPLAVQVAFAAEASLDGAEVVWVFARELLNAGLSGPAGKGDVRLWPCASGRTVVAFEAPEGVAVVEFDTPDVRRFLAHSYAAVPREREEHGLRLEAGLAALLGGV